MSRTRLGAGAAALALAIAAAGPLTGCGDDEAEDSGARITTIPAEELEAPEESPDPAGTEPPLVPDEGHEGGGPDPGTEEAEQATGGSSPQAARPGERQVEPADGGEEVSSGGASPTEAFEQFCEQNPSACE